VFFLNYFHIKDILYYLVVLYTTAISCVTMQKQSQRNVNICGNFGGIQMNTDMKTRRSLILKVKFTFEHRKDLLTPITPMFP